MGFREPRSVIQTTSLDSETRIAIWNVLVVLQEVFKDLAERYSPDAQMQDRVVRRLWLEHFKKPRDERPSFDRTVWMQVKNEVLEGEWFDVLDVVERSVQALRPPQDAAGQGETYSSAMAKAFNDCFEKFLVGYRFIGQEIVPVDSSEDAEAVRDAIDSSSVVSGSRRSLSKAVELLADRQAPDYANSIKESISSVEAVTRRITGQTTLGAGLKQLEKAGLTLHPALKDGWLKLYGWSSDEDGVRHGSIDAATVDQAMAKYMLVTCSAFVSYLIEEARKTDLV